MSLNLIHSIAKSLVPGARTEPKRLPLEDIEKALDNLCTVPSRATSEASSHPPRIADTSFKHITNLLKHYEDHKGLKEWHIRPRIYTVLKGIRRLDAMNTFVRAGYMDDMLPFQSARELPDELGDSKGEFMRFQTHCLTDAKELEKGTQGAHVHFPGSADVHFIWQRHLGSGGFG